MDTEISQYSEHPWSDRAFEVLPTVGRCFLGHARHIPYECFDKIVKVVVGETDPKTFEVHRGVLAHHATYFSGALSNESFIEGQTGVVTLEEDDPEIFELFHRYIYTGTFFDPKEAPFGRRYSVVPLQEPKRLRLRLAEELSDSKTSLSFKSMIGLCIFADMRGATFLLDLLITLFLEKIALEEQIPVDLLGHLQSNVPEHCLVMGMFAYVIAHCAHEEDLVKYEEYLGSSLLVDVVKYQRRIIKPATESIFKRFTVKVNACRWHRTCFNRRHNQ